MHKRHIITINGLTQKISIAHNSLLIDILAQYAAYISIIPSTQKIHAPAWVIFNEALIVDADVYVPYTHPPYSIVTIEYALTLPYFKSCLAIACNNGLYIREINVSLILFTIFTWMRQCITDSNILQEKACRISRNFPEFFQPDALVKIYRIILQESHHNHNLSVQTAFKEESINAPKAPYAEYEVHGIANF